MLYYLSYTHISFLQGNALFISHLIHYFQWVSTPFVSKQQHSLSPNALHIYRTSNKLIHFIDDGYCRSMFGLWLLLPHISFMVLPCSRGTTTSCIVHCCYMLHAVYCRVFCALGTAVSHIAYYILPYVCAMTTGTLCVCMLYCCMLGAMGTAALLLQVLHVMCSAQ